MQASRGDDQHARFCHGCRSGQASIARPRAVRRCRLHARAGKWSRVVQRAKPRAVAWVAVATYTLSLDRAVPSMLGHRRVAASRGRRRRLGRRARCRWLDRGSAWAVWGQRRAPSAARLPGDAVVPIPPDDDLQSEFGGAFSPSTPCTTCSFPSQATSSCLRGCGRAGAGGRTPVPTRARQPQSRSGLQATGSITALRGGETSLLATPSRKTHYRRAMEGAS